MEKKKKKKKTTTLNGAKNTTTMKNGDMRKTMSMKRTGMSRETVEALAYRRRKPYHVFHNSLRKRNAGKAKSQILITGIETGKRKTS